MFFFVDYVCCLVHGNSAKSSECSRHREDNLFSAPDRETKCVLFLCASFQMLVFLFSSEVDFFLCVCVCKKKRSLDCGIFDELSLSLSRVSCVAMQEDAGCLWHYRCRQSQSRCPSLHHLPLVFFISLFPSVYYVVESN